MNRTTRLRPVSEKRERENVELRRLRAVIVERDGPDCALRTPWVCNPPVDLHHVISRARDRTLALEPTNLKLLCRYHHDWVHDHPAEATELGLLKSASR